jgi:hypothetical protein
MHAALRSRAVYAYPCINPMLDMTTPINIAELAIRIAIAFSVHLTNAKPYSPASGGKWRTR